MATVLRKAILQQEVMWILVQPDGTVRFAVPPQVPPSEFRGGPEHSVQEALALACAFLERMARHGRRWLVIVSDPFERPQPLEGVGELRPLSADERKVLEDLQMDIPLGEWASAVRLQLVEPAWPTEVAS